MKLLVFAHTPPPHHGQSYMVQLMLEGFGGDCRRRSRRTGPAHGGTPQRKQVGRAYSRAAAGNQDPGTAREYARPTFNDPTFNGRVPNGYGIDCYHVNAQLSTELEDIGDIRPAKLLWLLGYCLQAIWVRFRYGVTSLYYVPAPGKYSAVYRDWIVMLLCRPFFKKIILHWHAAGLAKWLETAVQVRTRSLTFRLMKYADLSIILSKVTRADPEKLFSRQIRVVGNGIPDPCPDYEQTVLPLRRARLAARCQLLANQPPAAAASPVAHPDPQVFKVLYLAHCTREKGLFDAVEAVLQANRKLAARRFPISMQLQVAGGFLADRERAEFDQILARPETGQSIRYLGFVAGEQKLAALRDADAFCFPTYYDAESFGLVVVEAMAFGLPIVATHWRSIPGLLPPDYPGLVKIRSPHLVADALLAMMTSDTGEALRALFLGHFTVESYLQGLADAFHSAEADGQPDISGRLVPAAAP